MTETYAFDRLPPERRSAIAVTAVGAVMLLAGFLEWESFAMMRGDVLYAGLRDSRFYNTGFIGSARILGFWIPNAVFALFVIATIALAWLRALRLFAANLYAEVGVHVIALFHLAANLLQSRLSDGWNAATGIGWLIIAAGQIALLGILLKSFARQAAQQTPNVAAGS